MPQVEITVGISNSGKTTYATERARSKKWININRDDFRQVLSPNIKEYKFTDENELLVKNMQASLAQECIDAGKNIIISDTNLTLDTRQFWKAFAKRNKAGYCEKVFDTPLRVCLARNIQRDYSVPPSVIINMSKLMREYLGLPVYDAPTNAKPAIIVDIDGTLAHMDRALRSPYGWKDVGLDTVDNVIADMVRRYAETHTIIILSGRDSICRKETESWLLHNQVPYNFLYMRPEGDQDSDVVIKEALFWKHCAEYNIQFVLDDRDSVVDMWREIGLKCLQVAPGAF